jgi:hypothetical protein
MVMVMAMGWFDRMSPATQNVVLILVGLVLARNEPAFWWAITAS